MNKKYITPLIEAMDIQPEEMIADSKAVNAILNGKTIGNGYGGVAGNGIEADSRFFDDLGWDLDDDFE